MQTLRIFISSPGDVTEERQITGRVIERLQGKYWSFVRLDDVFWEQKVVRSTAHYQDELINPGDCEMVLGILWSRLGSPLPEKFRKQTGERYQSGTEWELEIAFDAYEKNLALTGDPVASKPDIIIYRRREARPVHDDEATDARAADQARNLDAYLKENYWFPDGTIKRPITGYISLDEFEKKLSLDLEQLILRHIPSLKPGFEPPPISGSPFKGLHAFDFIDNDRYFGRNREIREIQQQIIASAQKGLPFLLIYGGSGYGKSSLMRAGLAPVLTRPGGSLDSITGWRRVPFQPAKGNGALVERLARAILQPTTPEEAEQSRDHRHWPLTGLAELSGGIDGTTWDTATLARHFTDDDPRASAVAAVVQTLESLNRYLLLEIDQLEELFTTPEFDPTQRAAFLKTIGELSATGRVWTVATMRSEFFPRIAEQPELFQLVGKDRGYILPPPDRQSLREIIRYPALAARLDFERRIHEIEIAGEKAKHDYLHDQILADAESSPDALPLLEFTLQQLYDERSDSLLTWSSYASAGGLKGAIAKRATDVYQTLDPVAREARHPIFAALVHIYPTKGTITRKRTPLASFKTQPGSETFLQAFLGAHLIITDEDTQSKEPVVTLAHEALITHWDELCLWIKEHQGDLLARQRLAEQAGLWIVNDRKKSYLLAEARLAEAARVAESRLFTLDDDEQNFLDFSRKRANAKKRVLIGAYATFAMLFLGISASVLRAKSSELLAKSQAIQLEKTNLELKSRSLELYQRSYGSSRDLLQASSGIELGDAYKKGVAYLVDSLRYDPSNELALEDSRLRLSRPALTEILPMYFPLKTGSQIVWASFTGENLNIRTEDKEGIIQEWDPVTGRMVGDAGNTRKRERFQSPDGKWYVHVWADARIHDAESGKPVGNPIGSPGGVWFAEFTPDSSRVITGGHDGILEVWEVPGGNLLKSSDYKIDPITLIRFNSDGSLFLVACQRGDNHTPYHSSFQLWDTETFTPVGGSGVESITKARFSPDGKRIVTLNGSDVASIWYIDDLKKPYARTIPCGSNLVDACFDSSGNHILTVSESGEARIWDAYLLGGSSNHILDLTNVTGASFSADGNRMLSISSESGVTIWNTRSGEKSGELILRPSEVDSAAFSPDGKQILTLSQEGAHLWETSSRKLVSEITLTPGTYTRAAFIPNAGFLTLVPSEGMKRWDAKLQNQIGNAMGDGLDILDFAISDDGQFALTADTGSMARIWNLTTNQQIGDPVPFDWMGLRIRLAFQPGKHRVALAAGNHYLWDVDESSGLIRQLVIEGAANATIYSADGKYFAIERNSPVAPSGEFQSGRKKGLEIYDAASSKLLLQIEHDDNISSSSFAGDSNLVATASSSGVVQIWDFLTGSKVGSEIRGVGESPTISYSSDASLLIIISSDNIATLVSTKSTLNAEQLISLLQPLYGSRVSPSGALEEIPGNERLEMIDRLVSKRTGDSEYARAIRFYFFPELY